MSETKFNELKEKKVSWEQLFLDPNNPRLHDSTKPLYNLKGKDAFEIIQRLQADLEGKMSKQDLEDVWEPMKDEGFISKGIGQMLVRKIEEDKYLTLEGNRRLSSIRYLMREKKDELDEKVVKSFENMTVVDCTKLTAEEIEKYLGMIHVGGTKPWALLPKSKHLFSQFIRELCKLNSLSVTDDRFQDDYLNKHFNPLLNTSGQKAKEIVAKLNTTKPKDVQNSIALYRMYIQVNKYLEDTNNKPLPLDKASMLIDTYNSANLRNLFDINQNNCNFSAEGLDRWVDACVDTKTNLDHPDEDKQGAVITAPASGDSSLRQLNNILKDDPSQEIGHRKPSIQRVLNDRVPAGEVYADLKSRIQQSNLENTLKQVKALLGKIKLDELEEEFSDKAESLLEEIKVKFGQIDGATNR
tara:strand:+ start:606 stop:1841 length:1236 start_codon:yes stop_codon:yes gene_type:complete